MERYIKVKKRKRKDTEEMENLPPPKIAKTEVNSFQELEYTVEPQNAWYRFLQKEFKKSYFKDLKKFLVSEEKAGKQIYPPVRNVFEIFSLCPLTDVKVVILGQDPYHQKGQAHGLCFSVQKGVKIPPSLRNMFKELGNDINGFTKPTHGDLSGWARQGVFLLNDVLTVLDSNAHSHAKKGWETFTASVIAHINEKKHGVVFMLWGNHAKKKGKNIDKKKHFVLSCGHPSPLSQRYFLGCKHFSQANKYLKEHDKVPIKWGDL